jgi:hypothetical protein
MKTRIVAGAICATLASFALTAGATVTTAGADFHAANPSDQSKLFYYASGLGNNDLVDPSVSVIGSIKREPASASDGSQTVAISFSNLTAGTVLNVAFYATNGDGSVGGNQSAGGTVDSNGNLTVTATFPASELVTTSFIQARVSLPSGGVLRGAYAN